MALKPSPHQLIHVGETVELVIKPEDIIEVQRDDGLVVYVRVGSVAHDNVDGTIIGFEGRYANIPPEQYPIAELGKPEVVTQKDIWAVFHKD